MIFWGQKQRFSHRRLTPRWSCACSSSLWLGPCVPPVVCLGSGVLSACCLGNCVLVAGCLGKCALSAGCLGSRLLMGLPRKVNSVGKLFRIWSKNTLWTVWNHLATSKKIKNFWFFYLSDPPFRLNFAKNHSLISLDMLWIWLKNDWIWYPKKNNIYIYQVGEIK